MSKRDDIRQAIEAADPTGIVANEELLASFETSLPLLRESFPGDDLHTALPDDHGAHESIDRIQAELEKPVPHPAALKTEVGRLRSVRELEATVANWWDSPVVQRIVDDLQKIGL
jgi:hypothetical protein